MSAPSIRRNGKPPACEPCRKSRLRCDHVHPSCGRCNRRRISEQCIYHPAPMTRSFAVSSQPSTARQASTPALPSPVQSVARHIQTPSTPNSDAASPASTPITGFLGLTSYAAVFTEQQADLDISLAAQHRSSTSHPSPQLRTNQDQDRVRAGVRLLSMFRDLPLLTRLVEHWYRHAHGTVPKPIQDFIEKIRI
jgi:chromatin structure-remodeling complex subunit RSC3/30